MKSIVFSAVAGLLICLYFGTQLRGAEKPAAPNIVMIFADDWGWGDLSCHGSDWIKTPHLDRLAAQGTDFHQFTVDNPVCSPSRTALMTGHFPARHSVHQHFSTIANHQRMGMPDWLDPAAPMLPRLLQSAGYTTAHFGKWHLTNRDVDDAPLPPKYGYDEYGAFNLPGPQITVDECFDKAIDFIRRHKDKPFFVNLWIHETHTPHYPKKAWLEKFKHLEEKQQVYAAVVGNADARIGDVLRTLDDLDLDEKTLVVFSSDNGPENSSARKSQGDNSTGAGLGTYYSVGTTGGQTGQKRSLYGGGVRVPFIVRWPGQVAAGATDKTSVITAVDLLPTFCAIAGAKLPADYQSDGENRWAAITGEKVERTKPIYWQWQGNPRGPNWPRLGVQQGPWKLLMDEANGRVELYRVFADWPETNDVSDQHAEVVTKLRNMAKHWEATLPKNPPASCFSKARRKKS